MACCPDGYIDVSMRRGKQSQCSDGYGAMVGWPFRSTTKYAAPLDGLRRCPNQTDVSRALTPPSLRHMFKRKHNALVHSYRTVSEMRQWQ